MNVVAVASRPTFLMGTHMPNWLEIAGVPLFVCDRRLRKRKTFPIAIEDWSLDSGGFTELQKFGTWTVTPGDYVARIRRYRDQIGRLAWCAPQDWMCEPIIINGGWANGQRFVGTHLSVAEHQRRTVENFVQLRDLAPDLPFVPVVQGFTQDEYMACIDLYEAAGVNLAKYPLVGLGSICRRQGTAEAHDVMAALHKRGITRLHGFGVKKQGLARYGHLLASADSLAWSYDARMGPIRLPGCTTHKNCANCLHYALIWRAGVFDAPAGRAPKREPRQNRNREATVTAPTAVPLFQEVPVATSSSAPFGAPPSWTRVVVERAGGQCECAGQCGQHKTAGRCPLRHGGRHKKRDVVLVLAPKKPGLPMHVAARLPDAELAAWCHECLTRTERLAKPPA